jgi:uncharacterized Zn finger protein (UPF0148 family)
MAGSAGSPPPTSVCFTAFVCACPDRVPKDGAHFCATCNTFVAPVEVVPREQSDALAEALEEIASRRDMSAVSIAQKALNSYREATSE